jgi:hypothetical protein
MMTALFVADSENENQNQKHFDFIILPQQNFTFLHDITQTLKRCFIFITQKYVLQTKSKHKIHIQS